MAYIEAYSLTKHYKQKAYLGKSYLYCNMALYVDYSTTIHQIYLKYITPEDIY